VEARPVGERFLRDTGGLPVPPDDPPELPDQRGLRHGQDAGLPDT
jgi:hypothetical protein